MRYYPIHLDIQNRKVLVVGGGGVGTRKVRTLLDCGARVTVVSLEASRQLRDLAATGKIKLEARAFRPDDLSDMFLVIGATNDEKLNQKISREADRLNTLCNIADRPQVCNFILPSIVHRDDLVITISTSGRSPALAKKLRQDLENQFGNEYGILLRLMGAIRERLLQQARAPEAHKPLFERLINSELLKMIQENKTDDINALLFDILGAGYKFEELMQG